jgi:hypothetical protein
MEPKPRTGLRPPRQSNPKNRTRTQLERDQNTTKTQLNQERNTNGIWTVKPNTYRLEPLEKNTRII